MLEIAWQESNKFEIDALFPSFYYISVHHCDQITQKTQYPPDHPQQAGSRQIGPRQLGPGQVSPTFEQILHGLPNYGGPSKFCFSNMDMGSCGIL